MFSFGQRAVIKQGGSHLISLPMTWVKSTNPEMKNVNLEMDNEERIIITSVPAESCRVRRTEGNTNYLKEGARNELYYHK
jgi:antitoxin component of MazEF toxin-antitoxin module